MCAVEIYRRDVAKAMPATLIAHSICKIVIAPFLFSPLLVDKAVYLKQFCVARQNSILVTIDFGGGKCQPPHGGYHQIPDDPLSSILVAC